MLPGVIELWETERKFTLHTKIYFYSLKKEENRGLELSAYGTGHMVRRIVKTTMKALPRYFVPSPSPSTAYLIHKGLQTFISHWKRNWFGGSWSQVAWVICGANTAAALPSQVWGIVARFSLEPTHERERLFWLSINNHNSGNIAAVEIVTENKNFLLKVAVFSLFFLSFPLIPHQLFLLVSVSASLYPQLSPNRGG